MENNFNDDNFEYFLQQQLQNHKMFPKDAVWRAISQKLHGDNKWPALTFAFVFIIGLAGFICLHFSNKSNFFSIKPALVPIPINKSNHALALANNLRSIPSSNNEQNQKMSTDMLKSAIAYNNNSIVNKKEELKQFNEPYQSSTSHSLFAIERSHKQMNIPIDFNDKPKIAVIDTQVKENVQPIASDNRNQSLDENKSLAIVQSNNLTPGEHILAPIDQFKSLAKHGKFSIQVYAAPSISYRKLDEDVSIIKGLSNGPVAISHVSDVNDVVRHKPSKGLEAGVSLLYDFKPKVRLKGGFQFNMRQYAIDAYRSNTEISSIALVEGNQIETLNTLVFIRNYNGNSSTELINRYYQLSMPLGLEWEVAGNKKLSFNIAGSIQPTYILNRNAYLLTTNFKNYAENSDFVRKWNINTNFEAFVLLTVGDVKWQLGPQIRYQPNSTFISRYPIHEHLIDYGIKLGISTIIR